MSGYSGFKHTTFAASLVGSEMPVFKGRAICYENGKRLWQKTSPVFRQSRGDALKDAQRISHDYLVNQSMEGA